MCMSEPATPAAFLSLVVLPLARTPERERKSEERQSANPRAEEKMFTEF